VVIKVHSQNLGQTLIEPSAPAVARRRSGKSARRQMPRPLCPCRIALQTSLCHTLHQNSCSDMQLPSFLVNLLSVDYPARAL
jgi:hypothetical protein